MEYRNPNYVCGICEEAYPTKEEALACELKHVGGPVRIRSAHYRSPKEGNSTYPDVIEFIMADETTQTYVFSEKK